MSVKFDLVRTACEGIYLSSLVKGRLPARAAAGNASRSRLDRCSTRRNCFRSNEGALKQWDALMFIGVGQQSAIMSKFLRGNS